MKYKQSVFRTFSLITQLGLSMIGPILLCILLGNWLEKRFQISLMIPLIIVGIVAGGRNVYALVRHANEDPEDKEHEEG